MEESRSWREDPRDETEAWRWSAIAIMLKGKIRYLLEEKCVVYCLD